MGSFLKFICSDYLRWNLKTMWWAKWKLSLPGSKIGPAKWFTQFFTIYSVLRHDDSLHYNSQEENSVVARYWFLIAQWLEHQHIKLEILVQAPVQNRIFPFEFYNQNIYSIYIYIYVYIYFVLLISQFVLFQFPLCPRSEGKVEKCKVVLFIELPYLNRLLHYSTGV